MKTWIVTGGVGSGKSSLCRLLHELMPSSATFDSDRVVHDLLGRPEVGARLLREFGPSVMNSDESVSRPALRQRVFTDPDARARLESILHPMVYRELGALCSRLEAARKTQVLIAEIPLFYESSSDFPADLVIVVATGPTLQQERLTSQRGLDADTAERIRTAQWPLSRKLDPADKVVWNDGSPELLRLQAQILVQQLDPL